MLLLIKIRAGKIRLCIPVLLPLLLYFVEMLGQLKVFVTWKRSGKVYLALCVVDDVRRMLKELRAEGAFDLVDMEAKNQENGKVFVNIALW